MALSTGEVYFSPQPSFFSTGPKQAEAFEAAAVPLPSPLQASTSRSNLSITQPPASAARVEMGVAPTLKPPLHIDDIPEEAFALQSVPTHATAKIPAEAVAELVAEILFNAIKDSTSIAIPTRSDLKEGSRYNENIADYMATQVYGALMDAGFEEEEYEQAGIVAEICILAILEQPGKAVADLNNEILTYVPQHVIRSIARVAPALDQAIMNAIARGVASGVARA